MFESFKDVLTVNEVCTALHLGKNSVYKLLQSGILQCIKIGKKYIIPKSFLIDFINQNRLTMKQAAMTGFKRKELP